MPKMLGGGNDWVRELVRAFGEDPAETRSLFLSVVVNEAVTVTIEKYVDRNNTDAIQIIKKIVWTDENNIPVQRKI